VQSEEGYTRSHDRQAIAVIVICSGYQKFAPDRLSLAFDAHGRELQARRKERKQTGLPAAA
jgi:hypothetical protein